MADYFEYAEVANSALEFHDKAETTWKTKAILQTESQSYEEMDYGNNDEMEETNMKDTKTSKTDKMAQENKSNKKSKSSKSKDAKSSK